MINYSLLVLEKVIVTQGLNDSLGKEFCINKGDYQTEHIELIINYLINYIETENNDLKDGETIGLGCWLVQFIHNGNYIELHELKDVINGNNKYEFSLDYTIEFIKSQLMICDEYNVKPNIPKIGQKITLSKEIYEGSEVNGVRYESPSHMTGWYLTSNTYKGDIKTLVVDHLYHILKERPDLVKFLALPAGYRFYKNDKDEEVWIDKEVLNS